MESLFRKAAAVMQETIDNVGAVHWEVSADAGYYSAKSVAQIYALCVDPFVAPEQTRHGRVVPPAHRGRYANRVAQRDRRAGEVLTRGHKVPTAMRGVVPSDVLRRVRSARRPPRD